MKKHESLFQIGEVAHLLGVSRKMLLDYESYGLISPTLTDPKTGYRYFDSNAVGKLQVIFDLRRADMPLRSIKDYLDGKITTGDQIIQLRKQIANIEIAIENLSVRNLSEKSISDVRETVIPAQKCVCRDFIADDVDAAIKAVASTYYDCLRKNLRLAKSSYHFCEFPKNIMDDDFYDVTNISMRVCIAISEENSEADVVIFPETRAVSVSYRGEYTYGIAAYEILRKYITENGLVPTGYPREYYLEGSYDSISENNIVLIVVPVNS